jgi:hypothetical protein
MMKKTILMSQLQKSLCTIPSKDAIPYFQDILDLGFRRHDLNKLVLQLALIFIFFGILVGCAGMQGRYVSDIEEIINVPGFSKKQIFDELKIYIAENFNSAKAVLEYENKESGTIIGNGRLPYPTNPGIQAAALRDWTIPFTMRVDIKDARFRCTFTNISIAWPATYGAYASSAGGRSVFYADEHDKVLRAIQSIPIAIEQSIKRSKKKDDW